MPDREMTIKNLGIIRTLAAVNPKYGVGLSIEDCVQMIPWLDDAIAMLKEQEPRVIAFQEIDNFEVLWLEVRGVDTEEGLAPWVKTKRGRWFSPLVCGEREPDLLLCSPEYYGRYGRCWTSRPTDEQREAVEWQ